MAPGEASAKTTWPPIKPGTLVRTTQPNMAIIKHWTTTALSKRKWDKNGQVITHHDSHGLCYDVRHEDGSVGCYDPTEFVIT